MYFHWFWPNNAASTHFVIWAAFFSSLTQVMFYAPPFQDVQCFMGSSWNNKLFMCTSKLTESPRPEILASSTDHKAKAATDYMDVGSEKLWTWELNNMFPQHCLVHIQHQRQDTLHRWHSIQVTCHGGNKCYHSSKVLSRVIFPISDVNTPIGIQLGQSHRSAVPELSCLTPSLRRRGRVTTGFL